jgi:guanylate kinase
MRSRNSRAPRPRGEPGRGAPRRGTVFVLSAPSGTGKTTLSKRLLRRLRGIRFSISYTTRERRPGERNGRDYFFITREQFEKLRGAGEFLETARVDGAWYGTSRRQAFRVLTRGIDLLLDIDTQGAAQIRRLLPAAVLIFLLPPGPDALRERHRKRGSDPRATRRRLILARREVLRSHRYDYIVFNDEITVALRDLESIVRAERCRRSRQTDRARRILRSFAADARAAAVLRRTASRGG